MTRKQISEHVRRNCEKFVESDKNYEFDSRLTCMCAVASYALMKSFHKCGYKAKLCVWDCDCGSHAFVLSDNIVYDITATQFNDERHVVIEEFNRNVPHFDLSFIGSKTKRISFTRQKKFFNSWPSGQRPITEIVKRLIVSPTLAKRTRI